MNLLPSLSLMETGSLPGCLSFQGQMVRGALWEECRQSLAAAVHLVLEDRREDGLRGVPEDAIREIATV
jgi:hypothetical protein